MSVIHEAMSVFAEGAQLAEKNLTKLVDKKKDQIEEQKELNKVLDYVEDARTDGNITDTEVNEIIRRAAEVGVNLSATEHFKRITNTHNGEHNTNQAVGSKNAWIDVKSEDWDDERGNELDNVVKKIERAAQGQEDDAGLTDVELNLQMTEYTDHLARMNNGASVLSELYQATRA